MNRAKYLSVLPLATLMACSQPASVNNNQPALKDIFPDFLMGAAINDIQATGTDSAVVATICHHFNSIVAENCMKSEVIHPERDRFDFTRADRFVKFGLQHNMFIIGHCLLWHSQQAPWFYTDDNGNDVSPDTLKARIRTHISTIMQRYKGQIGGWDVVNEAIESDGSYRQSKFYEILGEEYIPFAFQCAHEADPDAELYINDYSMNSPAKRETYVRIVEQLKQQGLRIDAIGMQTHCGMDYPNFAEYEQSLSAFAATGLKVMITELDMSALPTITESAEVSQHATYDPTLNPYPNGLPDSISTAWNARMDTIFNIFLRHKADIARVTAWGVCDADSWKNDWPVPGRSEYPLLLDRNYKLKPFIFNFINSEKK